MKRYSILFMILFLLITMFISLMIPSSTRWSTGSYLIVTVKNKDTFAYAVHGKNVKSSILMDDLILLDSVKINKKNILSEYHTKCLLHVCEDSTAIADYYYNYCYYLKNHPKNFIKLEDDGMDITESCILDREFIKDSYFP